MKNVYDVLSIIGAAEPIVKYRSRIDGLSREDHDSIEAFVEEFILEISSISIDMQMAEHRSRQGASFARGKSGGTKVLAVDNAVMFLNSLKRLLADAPYELHCLTSGSEALTFLGSNKPDVILLDIEMPEMDGYELARKIKQSGNKAPIIFITANSDREYVDRAVEVGAVGLLMKPLRINQLLAKLKEFM
jgi:CheY-like chemotaxis protein